MLPKDALLRFHETLAESHPVGIFPGFAGQVEMRLCRRQIMSKILLAQGLKMLATSLETEWQLYEKGCNGTAHGFLVMQ